MHCDTVMYSYLTGKEDCWETTGMCDVKRMKAGNVMLQCLGIYMLQPTSGAWQKYGRTYTTDEDYLKDCKKIFDTTMERYSDVIARAHNVSDILKNEQEGKISALMTVEDGRGLNGSIETLEDYYNWGVRLLTILWNKPNCLGFPTSVDPNEMAKGLTDFGKEAVVRMQELGMIVDVSHLSDGGFWDVVDLAKKPFVASHSNARALSPHRRNLTDEMIRAIGEKGGMIGLNLMPEFLHSDAVSKQSRVDLMVKHARYIVNVGGIDILGIGTDFDGFDGELEISGPDEMYRLFDALKADGFSEDELEKIAYKNSMRVFQDLLV